MIHTISNGQVTVSISERGAELQSIHMGETEYLWNGDPAHWSGRAPVLFPFIGALRGDRAACAQGEITLPKHGLARKALFKAEECGGDQICFMLSSDEHTLANYPYPFALRVIYALDGASLKHTFKVRNTGDFPMPYCIGGHPAFRVPLADGEHFEDYTVEFEYEETADCPTVNMDTCLINDRVRNRFLTGKKSFRLNHVLFRGDALVFDTLRSRSVKLYGPSGRGVRMDFDGMDYFAVWTMAADAPYVCLEPWTGTATLESEDNVFENKRGMRILAPGEEDCVGFTVTPF